MRGFAERHIHATASATRRLISEPLTHCLTILVIALSLAVPSSLYRIISDAASMAKGQAGPPAITVFLRTTVSQDQVTKLSESLKHHQNIAMIDFVSPEQGLKQLQQRLGTDDVLTGLDHNPLPPALIVHASSTDPAILLALQKEIAASSLVDQAKLDADWARRLHAMTHLLEEAIFALALIFAAAVVIVVMNTVRLQVTAAREEIEVCKLMGASDAFVRRPFVYFGMLQMLLGGCVAFGITELARLGFNTLSTEWLKPYGLSFEVQPFHGAEALIGLLLAVVLGWLAASSAVSSFLSRLRPR
jgi:cell division transport system permease protein